jgi:hypothetical protein
VHQKWRVEDVTLGARWKRRLPKAVRGSASGVIWRLDAEVAADLADQLIANLRMTRGLRSDGSALD